MSHSSLDAGQVRVRAETTDLIEPDQSREGVGTMSIDKSLKKGGGLVRARNVLTRSERLALLQEDDRWKPEQGVFNLPKTKYRKLAPGQSGPKRPGASA
jgi:small basic protein (TIGR04137 family)